MARKFISRGVAAVCIALAGCATQAPLSFDAAPAAHVQLPGEALDASAAYVVVVPHVRNRTGTQGSFTREVHIHVAPEGRLLAWLTTASAFGAHPVSIALALPIDRPTVVRVPPGRYFVSRVFVESQAVYYDIEESYSLFDARAGQLNYPGDWTIETGYHELTRGAQHIGWYFNATLAESASSDMGALAADGGVPLAELPRTYTRQQPERITQGER